MSDPTNEDTDLPGGHIAFAPKWVRDRGSRDPDHLTSPSIAETDFPDAEQLINSPRPPRSLNSRLDEVRPERSYWDQAAESGLPRSRERPISERDLLRRSLEHNVVRQPWPPRQRTRRPATLIAIAVVVASIGAAILLFIMDGLRSEWRQIPQLKTEFMSRFSGSAPGNGAPVSGSSVARAVDNSLQRNASLTAGNEHNPAVRGVTDDAILFGMAAPFTGSAKELGQQMKLGIETAFNLANDSGGINGRRVRLTAADDGYEPARTAEAMKQLYEKQQVFGFIGNVGTPTAMVALPYALERRTLFFGAFTGADLLRRDPPDRYVFNYRASYAEGNAEAKRRSPLAVSSLAQSA